MRDNYNWRVALKEMEESLARMDAAGPDLRAPRGNRLAGSALDPSKLMESPRRAVDLAALVNYTGTAVMADSRSHRPAIMVRVPDAEVSRFQARMTRPGRMLTAAGRKGSGCYQITAVTDQYLLGRLLRGRTGRWRSLADYLVMRGHLVAGVDNLEMVLKIGRFAPPEHREASLEVFGEADA
jgi:hypothetical protein